MAKKEVYFKEEVITEHFWSKTPEEIIYYFQEFLNNSEPDRVYIVDVRTDDEGGAEVYVEYYRFETDEEESARMKKEAEQKAALDSKERAEYLRLKAKFGG